MPDLSSLQDLRREGERRLAPGCARITVGLGTCGRAAGAQAVLDALRREAEAAAGEVMLDAVGCRGLCSDEPLVEVWLPDGAVSRFANVEPGAAAALVAFARGAASDADREALSRFAREGDPFRYEERRVLARCGVIDPRSIEEYVACGGYEALATVLAEGDPASVIAEVEASGLRGRGGAGFPTGAKWRACAEGDPGERYFIVNGDEGDPGAYMDRGLLESDPHLVLEGLIIGCFACGASRAYFFIRAEYPQAVETVRRAIEDARRCGLLGPDILGSGFGLEVSVVRGAGAFLCGESTAMANVLEGRRCTPRKKPPHLTEKGLWSRPTCVNNVETLANVPLILGQGAAWFREVGTAQSPGTKVLSVTGATERTGLVEVPFGVGVGALVRDVAQATDPKAVQIGGPSGAILPADGRGLDVSFESLGAAGAMVGSGGFVILGEEHCVVDTAAYLTRFSQSQSCGRCRGCREGLGEAADILGRVCAGQAGEDDLARLRVVAEATCADGTLCGLGRMALRPLLTSLDHFEEEYRAHLEGRCPSLACKELVSYVIDESKCQGERCCLGTCPGNAIKGPFGKPGRIVPRLCQKCGSCLTTCCYGAVKKVTGVAR